MHLISTIFLAIIVFMWLKKKANQNREKAVQGKLTELDEAPFKFIRWMASILAILFAVAYISAQLADKTTTDSSSPTTYQNTKATDLTERLDPIQHSENSDANDEAEKLAEALEVRLEELAKRTNIDAFSSAISNGDQKIYSMLPAKGYKNGFADVLKKYKLFVNPKYSFADCDNKSKIYPSGKNGAGCRVSLKLARKNGKELEDIGIRVEWAQDFEDKIFVPNNSAWAAHITTGDGFFEASIDNQRLN